jgi:hypothetical protein
MKKPFLVTPFIFIFCILNAQIKVIKRPSSVGTTDVSAVQSHRGAMLAKAKAADLGNVHGESAEPRPTSSKTGMFWRFERGWVYWSQNTGYCAIYGDIMATWASLGFEGSILGFPITDELDSDSAHPSHLPFKRMSKFENGTIYWLSQNEIYILYSGVKADVDNYVKIMTYLQKTPDNNISNSFNISFQGNNAKLAGCNYSIPNNNLEFSMDLQRDNGGFGISLQRLKFMFNRTARNAVGAVFLRQQALGIPVTNPNGPVNSVNNVRITERVADKEYLIEWFNKTTIVSMILTTSTEPCSTATPVTQPTTLMVKNRIENSNTGIRHSIHIQEPVVDIANFYKGVVILAHGDGGNEMDGTLNGQCAELAKAGYIAATMTYRPLNKGWNQDAISFKEDVESVITSIITKYNVSRSKVVVGGLSRGSNQLFNCLLPGQPASPILGIKGVILECPGGDAWKASVFPYPVAFMANEIDNDMGSNSNNFCNSINPSIKSQSECLIIPGTGHCGGSNQYTAFILKMVKNWLP